MNKPSPLTPEQSPSDCYHCGLPVAKPHEFTVVIQQQEREFCCPSCQAVAMMIQQGGLDQFYQYRSQLSRRPDQPSSQEQFSLYDREDVQASFVDHGEPTDDVQQSTAYLLLDDITCAACVWLIEKALSRLPGVIDVRVNASTHECALRWDHQLTPLSVLMAALSDIGYRPQPLTRDNQQKQRQQQQRTALMRLAVAAFGMMQVGMVSIGLHAGDIQGMDDQWLSYFRWISLLVATPVVLFSAQPFWSVAWRNVWHGHLTMEVPVSLAIVLAYVASAWATVMGTGEVYFDSVSMFTFFLLLGRYLEMRTRFNNHQQTDATTQLLPLVARKISPIKEREDEGKIAANTETHVTANSAELVLLAELVIGDRVQIRAGETVPCDGIVIEGHTAIIEAILTGEGEPVKKMVGDDVIAGTVNTDGTVIIQVTASSRESRLSTIEKLTRFAEQDKPKIQELANTVARYFVGAVLIVASAVFIFWSIYDPSQAFWIMLSVLVVTCPCALSLATPTVLTATTSAMRGLGLLVLKGHVIETLTKITQVVFDKTGTLTEGHPSVVEVHVLDLAVDKEDILAIAAALEEGASHPIANAFRAYSGRYRVTEREIVTGAGVRGVVDVDNELQLYSLGKPDFAADQSLEFPSKGQWLLLSKEQQPFAWIRLSDPVRASAAPAIEQFRQQALHVNILSGDHPNVVEKLSNELGDLPYQGGVLPEQKLAYIREQQNAQSPQVLLMVGDGINDVPVLAGADVSVAMGSASDFARTHADAVLLNSDLTVLPKAVSLAHRCRQIMRQNITFSLLYNVTALPLAAAGFIPPYIAAIGMSLSSLVVVINALRVSR